MRRRPSVDGRVESHQALVGADVGCRFLAAYVLLAGLKCEHEHSLPAAVGGGSDDSAGELAHQCFGRAHVAEIGAAVVEGHAERLSVAADDVGAQRRGSAEHAEGRRLTVHDQQSLGRVAGVGPAVI